MAWPLAVRAQQPIPIVGFLHSQSRDDPFEHLVAAFRQGLGELGFVEGRNVIIEFRWAEGHPERLPALANDLVRLPVAVLVGGGGNVSVSGSNHVHSDRLSGDGRPGQIGRSR